MSKTKRQRSPRSGKHCKEINMKKMQELNYSKVLTPKNMKSSVWKYFGFPGNNYNEVITKDYIYCTLCFSKFRNNRNTTNLRKHLDSCHKNILSTDCYDDNSYINTISSNSPRKVKSEQQISKQCVTKKVKRESYNSVKNPLVESTSLDDNDQCITIYPEDVTELEMDDMISTIETKSENIKNIRSLEKVNTANIQTHENIPEVNVKVSYNMEDSNLLDINMHDTLRDMIIDDLQSTDIICLKGFKNTLKILSKGYSVPQKEHIEESIYNSYLEKSNKMFTTLKSHSQHKPYALSYEIWENILNQQYITFYFYYISENFQINFKHIQLKTVKYSQFTNYDDIFHGYDLKNCTAVVGVPKDIIEEFFSRYDIPIIPCFECVIQDCINLIFNTESVNKDFSEIKLFLEELLLTQDIGIPNLYKDLPWTKYRVLSFFCEDICWSEDPTNELLQKAKNILSCMSHLKMTVDSLTEELNPISSLAWPLSNYLIENHFTRSRNDTDTISEIKDIIHIELAKSILTNDMLSVTSFLDPRFFRYLSDHCISSIKENLYTKLNKDEINCSVDNVSSTELEVDPLAKNSRKSGLKLLFSKTKDISSNAKLNKKNNFENDFQKYRIEATADLDECPLDWWNKYGYMYGRLKKFSDIYNCVPACCNNRYTLNVEARTLFEDRRANLTGNFINEILFLNYNK